MWILWVSGPGHAPRSVATRSASGSRKRPRFRPCGTATGPPPKLELLPSLPGAAAGNLSFVRGGLAVVERERRLEPQRPALPFVCQRHGPARFSVVAPRHPWASWMVSSSTAPGRGSDSPKLMTGKSYRRCLVIDPPPLPDGAGVGSIGSFRQGEPSDSGGLLPRPPPSSRPAD